MRVRNTILIFGACVFLSLQACSGCEPSEVEDAWSPGVDAASVDVQLDASGVEDAWSPGVDGASVDVRRLDASEVEDVWSPGVDGASVDMRRLDAIVVDGGQADVRVDDVQIDDAHANDTHTDDAATSVDAALADVFASSDVQPVMPTITTGEDYWLPTWAVADDYSGYVGNPQGLGTVTVRSYYMRWRTVEPTQGTYTFDVAGSTNDLRGVLDAAAAGGYRIAIFTHNLTTRIQYWNGTAYDPSAEQGGSAPDWIVNDPNIPKTRIEGWDPWHITYVKPDHARVMSAFHAMIAALGEFLTDNGYWDQVATTYVHGISPSRGEEFWGNVQTTEELEEAFGFSPATARAWLGARFAAFASAFAGHTRVLCWAGAKFDVVTRNHSYQGLGLEMTQLAWASGMGNRGGIIERYNFHTQDQDLGQSTDENGYLHTDEALPPIAERRYFGDENEEYGDSWSWRYGVDHSSPNRYRQSMLRALQRQLRFLWTSDAAESINPELSEYARLSFGKNVHNSPDAWAYLRESPVLPWVSPACIQYCEGGGTPVHALRNVERWLVQRDVPGGVTMPTQYTVRSFEAGGSRDPDEQWHDYESTANRTYFDYLARRTNGPNNPAIHFDIDDRFEIGSAQIKIEFLDDNLAEWRLEYSDGSILRSTALVQNTGSGEVRTATFAVAGIDVDGKLDHGMDLRIVRESPNLEVTVRWVRVVRERLPG